MTNEQSAIIEEGQQRRERSTSNEPFALRTMMINLNFCTIDDILSKGCCNQSIKTFAMDQIELHCYNPIRFYHIVCPTWSMEGVAHWTYWLRDQFNKRTAQYDCSKGVKCWISSISYHRFSEFSRLHVFRSRGRSYRWECQSKPSNITLLSSSSITIHHVSSCLFNKTSSSTSSDCVTTHSWKTALCFAQCWILASIETFWTSSNETCLISKEIVSSKLRSWNLSKMFRKYRTFIYRNSVVELFTTIVNYLHLCFAEKRNKTIDPNWNNSLSSSRTTKSIVWFLIWLHFRRHWEKCLRTSVVTQKKRIKIESYRFCFCSIFLLRCFMRCLRKNEFFGSTLQMFNLW